MPTQSWYYADGSEQRGPMSEEQLQQLAKVGAITHETLVWHEGMVD